MGQSLLSLPQRDIFFHVNELNASFFFSQQLLFFAKRYKCQKIIFYYEFIVTLTIHPWPHVAVINRNKLHVCSSSSLEGVKANVK